jgi:CheY-like chemotaxis protein
MNRPILVVDDDEVLRRILSRILAQQGHTVLPAADAAQAVRLARERRPCLALLDLCLPDRGGLELARQLRDADPGLTLVLMTAYPLRLCEHPELADDFAHVWTKPLDLVELRQAVEGVLAVDSDTRAGRPCYRRTIQ